MLFILLVVVIVEEKHLTKRGWCADQRSQAGLFAQRLAEEGLICLEEREGGLLLGCQIDNGTRRWCCELAFHCAPRWQEELGRCLANYCGD